MNMKKNTPYSDKKIMESSKRDPRYFGRMYQRYGKAVFVFFYRRVGSKEVAMDLTQEVFIKAFRNRHNFSYQGYPYSSYLFRIARNLLVNHYKKKKTLSLEGLEHEPSFRPSDIYNFDNELIWKATETLLPVEKVVLEERYKKGKRTKETAEMINKSDNAVKLILSRARKKLRNERILKEMARS